MSEDYSVKFMAKKSSWENIKGHALTKAGGAGMTGWTIAEVLQHMGLFKHGGRVRGVGVARRGFGKALRKE